MQLKSACALGAALFALAGAALVAAAVPGYIERALADPTRPADDRKVDADRKPGELLAYAGVKPGTTVAEFLPGGGYYTRLLSDVVGPAGKVYALETTTWGNDNVSATQNAIKGRGNVALDLAPLGTFHLPVKVDLFWTTLNYHDLHVPKYANVDIAAFNRQVFDSLKPGGIYLIVDHAAPAGAAFTLAPTLHRAEEATVVSEVTAAGFKLIGESDLLRHPADDHTKKVFDPSMHFKTDQFILKFRRP
jgi:predicted methyltransferase